MRASGVALQNDFDPTCNLLAKTHRPHAHALHTSLAPGLRVHHLGDSLGYALRLLSGDDAAMYNSPAYTPVAIEALEKILYVTDDTGICDAARALLEVGWQVVAEHYHVATRQWAGPFSRTYSDVTDSHFIRGRCPVSNALNDAPPWALAVPNGWADRFRVPITEETTIRRLFVNRAPPQIAVYGTTWMDAEACLGSATLENTTYQHRPLLGYWVVPGSDGPAVLRVRCLRDGHDFASCVLRCTQNGPRILAAVSFAGNLGDVQHVADRPAEPVFATSRLAVRVQVASAGAQAEVLNDGRCRLTAGARCVILQPLPAAPFGQTVRWLACHEQDVACVDGVLFEAANPVALDLRKVVAALGLSLELSQCDEGALTAPPSRTTEGFAWPDAGLTLRASGFADYTL